MGIILWAIWGICLLANFPQAAEHFGYEQVSWWWFVGSAVAIMAFNFLTATLFAIVGAVFLANRWG